MKIDFLAPAAVNEAKKFFRTSIEEGTEAMSFVVPEKTYLLTFRGEACELAFVISCSICEANNDPLWSASANGVGASIEVFCKGWSYPVKFLNLSTGLIEEAKFLIPSVWVVVQADGHLTKILDVKFAGISTDQFSGREIVDRMFISELNNQLRMKFRPCEAEEPE